MNISRRNLLQASASIAITARADDALLPQEPQAANTVPGGSFYPRLVEACDRSIPDWLNQLKSGSLARTYVRRVGEAIDVLTAAFCAPESSFHQSETLIQPLQDAAESLLKVQYPDGTIDAGNLHSSPDTGFVLEIVCAALTVLRQRKDARLAGVEDKLGAFIISGGKAVTSGGIHTPNHRWVISAALARVHSLFPDKKYLERIDDWLGEGIYCDADGQYSERSVGIYSRVIDNALVTMARLLGRPALLEPVRRNLNMNIYYTHPDGELETVGSRRQDAGMVTSIANYYLQYRYLAAHDSNAEFAGVVEFIETKLAANVLRSNPLIYFVEDPLLRSDLPQPAPLPSSYTRFFQNSGLVRLRQNDASATVFGGTDWPLGVASGLSSTPTFFRYRKGRAVLESIRMGAQFFSLGAFHSSGVRMGNNDGYVLEQTMAVPYYQPLPASDRNLRGDYRLTPVKDERFWSKLNFPERQMSNVQTLVQKVTIFERAGVFEFHLEVSGHAGVPYTIELAFRPGGEMEGKFETQAEETYFLKEGAGRYRVGSDWIEFGPGEMAHDYVHLEDASYTIRHGSLRQIGPRAYINLVTPLQKTIAIRSS
jgi:hypothetical protein